MAASGLVCSHYRLGYCKYKEKCRHLHVEELCKIQGCSSDSCVSRHPRRCRYFNLFGTCKFRDNCAYSHESFLKDEISAIRQKLNDVTKRLDDVVQAIANLQSGMVPMEMRNPTPPTALDLGDSSPESISDSDIPQLDGANCVSEYENPSVLNLDDAELQLDIGLSGEVMEKLDEYLWVDPSPSPQTLYNIACGLNIQIVKVRKYVEWKQSKEMTPTMF